MDTKDIFERFSRVNIEIQSMSSVALSRYRTKQYREEMGSRQEDFLKTSLLVDDYHQLVPADGESRDVLARLLSGKRRRPTFITVSDIVIDKAVVKKPGNAQVHYKNKFLPGEEGQKERVFTVYTSSSFFSMILDASPSNNLRALIERIFRDFAGLVEGKSNSEPDLSSKSWRINMIQKTILGRNIDPVIFFSHLEVHESLFQQKLFSLLKTAVDSDDETKVERAEKQFKLIAGRMSGRGLGEKKEATFNKIVERILEDKRKIIKATRSRL